MGHTLTKRSASQHHLFTAPRSEKKDQFILSIEIICPTISNIALTLSLNIVHAIVECLVQRKLSNTVGSWSICQVSLNSSGGKAVSESYHRIWSHCLRLWSIWARLSCVEYISDLYSKSISMWWLRLLSVRLLFLETAYGRGIVVIQIFIAFGFHWLVR